MQQHNPETTDLTDFHQTTVQSKRLGQAITFKRLTNGERLKVGPRQRQLAQTFAGTGLEELNEEGKNLTYVAAFLELAVVAPKGLDWLAMDDYVAPNEVYFLYEEWRARFRLSAPQSPGTPGPAGVPDAGAALPAHP